jgi:hypothetical protein
LWRNDRTLPLNTPLSAVLNAAQLAQLQAANPTARITGATTLEGLPAGNAGQLGALGGMGLPV